jgi:hypothetical protein
MGRKLSIKFALKAVTPIIIIVGALIGSFAVNVAVLACPQNIEIKRPNLFSSLQQQAVAEEIIKSDTLEKNHSFETASAK